MSVHDRIVPGDDAALQLNEEVIVSHFQRNTKLPWATLSTT